MYENKVIDGLLKHIPKKVVGNAFRYYINDVAFNATYMAGLPNMHLVPTFTERKEKQLYDFILRILPEDYAEHGLKVV